MAIELKNSNLYLTGAGYDTNGNKVVKLQIGSNRGFSIQTNGNMPKTHSLIAGKKTLTALKELSTSQLRVIEQECISYIKKYGTPTQRQKLRGS